MYEGITEWHLERYLLKILRLAAQDDNSRPIDYQLFTNQQSEMRKKAMYHHIRKS